SPLSSSEHKTKMKRVARKTQNEKYRLKYLRLRKATRALVFENAALCDEVAHLEEKFLKAKEERRFLLKSLLQYQALTDGEIPPTPSSSCHPPVPPVALTSGPTGAAGLPGGSNLLPVVTSGEDGTPKKPKKERKERGRENGKEEYDPQNAIVASSARTCYANLLKVTASSGYHTKHRLHFLNAFRKRNTTICSQFSSKSATPVAPSGEDFFGFSHPTIQNLVQSCPGARKCSK
ncbi:unnamed protein product, partial [Tetraodon nigroviridis]